MSPCAALFAVPEDANRWTERATGPSGAARRPCASGPAGSARFASTARPRRGGSGDLNQGWIAAGLAPLDNGIGLEFGEVLHGSVGSAGHRAVSVLGEVVNTAALLEGKTRALGIPILMSEALAIALPPARRAALTPLGEVELRRSAPPMVVFGVVS